MWEVDDARLVEPIEREALVLEDEAGVATLLLAEDEDPPLRARSARKVEPEAASPGKLTSNAEGLFRRDISR